MQADGIVVAKPSEAVDEAADLRAEAAHPWVGRAALKLEHALDLWAVSVEGRIVLDIGASTGGFTEVCLARGARRVFAVDVGHGQLHPRVAAEPRVVNLEGVDARALDATIIDAAPDLIVCDASFIGLAKVLPAALALARPGADLIALVKPQFEAGPEAVGKGGLVRNEETHARVLADVRSWLESIGWSVLATADSPITGGSGNREHLLHARRR